MRLVFAGTPPSAVPSLRALLASRHQVVAVVTRPEAPAGRGRRVRPSAVAEASRDAGLETMTPSSPRDPSFLDRLAALAPDCCPVVAYGGLIPPKALDLPSHGWVNLHFSVLPAWRGAAPVQRAILAGDDVTGATTFRLVEELDGGPIYGVMTSAIRPDDTAGSLLARLADEGAGLLVATLDGIEDGALEPRPQPAEGVSLAPKLTVDDARVDWGWSPREIDLRVRACTPAPGAWTTVAGRRLKLAPVRAPAASIELAPGEARATRRDVLVGTAGSPVALTDVQAEGKPWMRAADWARGLRVDSIRLGE